MTDQQHETSEQQPLWDDPVIEDLRDVRRKLWEASGCDIRRFIEQSRQAAERRANANPPHRDAG